VPDAYNPDSLERAYQISSSCKKVKGQVALQNYSKRDNLMYRFEETK